jgi:transcriptional regulator with PAS, ATPase and Fis domain
MIQLETGQFVGTSNEMKKIYALIHKLAKVDTSVLIRGESGTGKELIARAVHFNSFRKDQKLVALNCSAIAENLFESELFGHEKGAFTGADQRHIGKFQYAEGGTLFLDEIGDLSLAMQVKLLRVLQEKKFTPVGSNREIKADVRIIAATNRNLEEMVQKQTFREDLFYRLNVLPLYLPPLRERKEDIEKLVTHFMAKFNERHKKLITSISTDSLKILENHDWPGNIRELENVIEHAFVLEGTSSIESDSLPFYLRPSYSQPKNSAAKNPDSPEQIESELDYPSFKEQFERDFIIKALKLFKGRINQTALHAKIPKKTLLRKLQKYSIQAEDYRI